jgi:hypothetical protein
MLARLPVYPSQLVHGVDFVVQKFDIHAVN